MLAPALDDMDPDQNQATDASYAKECINMPCISLPCSIVYWIKQMSKLLPVSLEQYTCIFSWSRSWCNRADVSKMVKCIYSFRLWRSILTETFWIILGSRSVFPLAFPVNKYHCGNWYMGYVSFRTCCAAVLW